MSQPLGSQGCRRSMGSGNAQAMVVAPPASHRSQSSTRSQAGAATPSQMALQQQQPFLGPQAPMMGYVVPPAPHVYPGIPGPPFLVGRRGGSFSKSEANPPLFKANHGKPFTIRRSRRDTDNFELVHHKGGPISSQSPKQLTLSEGQVPWAYPVPMPVGVQGNIRHDHHIYHHGRSGGRSGSNSGPPPSAPMPMAPPDPVPRGPSGHPANGPPSAWKHQGIGAAPSRSLSRGRATCPPQAPPGSRSGSMGQGHPGFAGAGQGRPHAPSSSSGHSRRSTLEREADARLQRHSRPPSQPMVAQPGGWNAPPGRHRSRSASHPSVRGHAMGGAPDPMVVAEQVRHSRVMHRLPSHGGHGGHGGTRGSVRSSSSSGLWDDRHRRKHR